MTRQSIQELTAPTYRDDWALITSPWCQQFLLLHSSSSKWYYIFPATDWPHRSFLPTDWQPSRSFVFSVATDWPGAAWLRSVETKEAVMDNFILSLSLSSPGKIILEGDTGHGTIFPVGGGHPWPAPLQGDSPAFCSNGRGLYTSLSIGSYFSFSQLTSCYLWRIGSF